MAIDWKIHLVANGVRCSVCGETENGFLPGITGIRIFKSCFGWKILQL